MDRRALALQQLRVQLLVLVGRLDCSLAHLGRLRDCTHQQLQARVRFSLEQMLLSNVTSRSTSIHASLPIISVTETMAMTEQMDLMRPHTHLFRNLIHRFRSVAVCFDSVRIRFTPDRSRWLHKPPVMPKLDLRSNDDGQCTATASALSVVADCNALMKEHYGDGTEDDRLCRDDGATSAVSATTAGRLTRPLVRNFIDAATTPSAPSRIAPAAVKPAATGPPSPHSVALPPMLVPDIEWMFDSVGPPPDTPIDQWLL